MHLGSEYRIPTGEHQTAGLRWKYICIDDLAREIILNAISLAMGFVGNLSLLVNFTRRIRYIIALPMTIIAWYFATGIVSLAADHEYASS